VLAQPDDRQGNDNSASRPWHGVSPPFGDRATVNGGAAGSDVYAMSGMMRIATMFATLIIGLIAGPDVSL
jgi:hypothetical protein